MVNRTRIAVHVHNTHAELQRALCETRTNGVVVTVVDVFAGAFGPCRVMPSVLDDAVRCGETHESTTVVLIQANAGNILSSPTTHPKQHDTGDAGTGSPHSSDTSDTSSEADHDTPTAQHSDGADTTAAPTLHESVQPAFYTRWLEEQAERSKPLFLLYKDGAYKDKVHGVHTPHLKKLLCALANEAKPPSFYLQGNAPFLRLWQLQYGEAVDVTWKSFVKAVDAWLMLSPGAPQMTDSELTLLSERVKARQQATRYNNYAASSTMLRGAQRPQGAAGGGDDPAVPGGRRKEQSANGGATHLSQPQQSVSNPEEDFIRALWRSGVVCLSNVADFVGGGGVGGEPFSFERCIFQLLPDFARRVKLWQDIGSPSAKAESCVLKSALKKGGPRAPGDPPEARKVAFQESHTSHHDDAPMGDGESSDDDDDGGGGSAAEDEAQQDDNTPPTPTPTPTPSEDPPAGGDSCGAADEGCGTPADQAGSSAGPQAGAGPPEEGLPKDAAESPAESPPPPAAPEAGGQAAPGGAGGAGNSEAGAAPESSDVSDAVGDAGCQPEGAGGALSGEGEGEGGGGGTADAEVRAAEPPQTG